MRILMIGSYSSLFENYYDAMKDYHEIFLAGNGDGWKAISTSHLPFPVGNNILSRGYNLLNFILFKINSYRRFDLVIIQSPFVFGGIKFFFNFNLFIIKFLKKNNTNIAMLIAGNDYIVYSTRFDMQNNPFDRSIKIDFNGLNPYIDRLFIKNNLDVIKVVDKIFFSSPMYALGYIRFSKCHNIPIQLPAFKLDFNEDKKGFNANEIVIYHGINRVGFKGSDVILRALDRLKASSYQNYRIIVSEKIPFKSFVDILKSCDIYIDQCFSDDYGMATILALGLGKVVLTSLASYCERENDYSNSPIVRIHPNEEMIFMELKRIITSQSELLERSDNAIPYVLKYHSPIESLSAILDAMGLN